MLKTILIALVWIGSWFWAIIPITIWSYFYFKGKKRELSKSQKAWKKGAGWAFLIFFILRILNYVV